MISKILSYTSKFKKVCQKSKQMISGFKTIWECCLNTVLGKKTHTDQTSGIWFNSSSNSNRA